MKGGRGTFRRVAIAFSALPIIGTLILVLAWVMYPRQVVVSAPFVVRELDISVHDYYDLGIADINRDGFLDVFTTNHSSRQSVLLSDGHGGFYDRFATFGMEQSPGLPGLEDTGDKPAFDGPGLYIYFLESMLFLTHIASPGGSAISGEVTALIEPTIVKTEGFTAGVRSSGKDDEFARITFESETDGELAIEVSTSLPVTLSLSPSVPLEQVFVGSRLVHPVAHEVLLSLKDRHGIAWADVNGDDMQDAYISRGAFFGRGEEYSDSLADQFFVSVAPDRYVDRALAAGFRKRGCPGRQVAWVDVNGDTRLDLYVACGRQVGGFWEYVPRAFRFDRRSTPNQLYLQSPDGNFRDAAPEYGLDFELGGTFLWLDVDADADADLLWASEQEITLHRNTGSTFSREVLLPESTTTQVRKLAAVDFDSDGDLDVFAAASLGSVMLVNTSGSFRVVDPDEYGLPSRTRTVAWVDVENDGLMDLYAWPGGIFLQRADGRFVESGILRVPSPYWPFVDPRSAWFDYDNDGDRDLIVMQRFFPHVLQHAFSDLLPFTAVLLQNNGPLDNHWFQFELEGGGSNRNAIGATVTVTTRNGRQTQMIGQFETSHYSQGHYRLYFGLGTEEEPESVVIHWPDGLMQTVTQPLGRRIVFVPPPASPLEPIGN